MCMHACTHTRMHACMHPRTHLPKHMHNQHSGQAKFQAIRQQQLQIGINF